MRWPKHPSCSGVSCIGSHRVSLTQPTPNNGTQAPVRNANRSLATWACAARLSHRPRPESSSAFGLRACLREYTKTTRGYRRDAHCHLPHARDRPRVHGSRRLHERVALSACTAGISPLRLHEQPPCASDSKHHCHMPRKHSALTPSPITVRAADWRRRLWVVEPRAEQSVGWC